MKKLTLQSLLLLSFVVAFVFPVASWSQSLSSGDAKECLQVTGNNKDYVSLMDEFLLPANDKYKIGSWRVDETTAGVSWQEDGIKLDEHEFHRIGRFNHHITFTLFGPSAGPVWLAYRPAADSPSIKDVLECGGYDLSPIVAPEGLVAFDMHRVGKQGAILVHAQDVDAVCITSYLHSVNECQFEGFLPAIERYTPAAGK